MDRLAALCSHDPVEDYGLTLGCPKHLKRRDQSQHSIGILNAMFALVLPSIRPSVVPPSMRCPLCVWLYLSSSVPPLLPYGQAEPSMCLV